MSFTLQNFGQEGWAWRRRVIAKTHGHLEEMGPPPTTTVQKVLLRFSDTKIPKKHAIVIWQIVHDCPLYSSYPISRNLNKIKCDSRCVWRYYFSRAGPVAQVGRSVRLITGRSTSSNLAQAHHLCENSHPNVSRVAVGVIKTFWAQIQNKAGN